MDASLHRADSPAERVIITGDEANALVRELAVKRSQGFEIGEAVPTGIDYLDTNNPPLMRGELALVLGLTSHGKSLFSATLARNTLKRLGKNSNAGLLVVMTEETVEARRIQTWGDSRVTIKDVLLGRAPIKVIDDNISKSANDPIYFVGQTTSLTDVGTRNGTLRPSSIATSVHDMISRGIAPELVIVDHAHDLEPDRHYGNEQEKHDAVAEELKQLANALGRYCPMLVLGQCRKEVENRNAQQAQPSAYDLKFMQALAARARDIYTVYYPTKHSGNGMTFKTAKGPVQAAKGLFMVHVAKARNGTCAGDTIAMTAFDETGKWGNYLTEV